VKSLTSKEIFYDWNQVTKAQMALLTIWLYHVVVIFTRQN